MVSDTSVKQIGPQEGKQTEFLESSADIVVYGGAAGGGKTFGLLLEALRHIGNPDYRCLIFRRTSPMIENPGGLADESQKIYPKIGLEYNKKHMEWSAPGMGHVRFGHMQYENDKLNFQGAQIDLIGWDELTHFTRGQFIYMLSRSRSTSGVRPYIRATTNPDAESWVKDFLGPWVDDEWEGYRAGPGEILWLLVVEEQFTWMTDEEKDVHLADHGNDSVNLLSVTFIPADLDDNPLLVEADPAYKAKLEAMSYVDRERLLHSNWNVVPGEGTVFNRDWFKIITQWPDAPLRLVRYWDLASTKKSSSRRKPDYTVGILVGKDPENRIYILDVKRMQESPNEVMDASRAAARDDGLKTQIVIEQEPGSSGVFTINYFVTKVLMGYAARGARTTGSKYERAKPLSAQAEVGNVYVMRASWTELFLRELDLFPNSDFDDQVDAASGAFQELAVMASPWDEEFDNWQRQAVDQSRPTMYRREEKVF